MHSNSVLKDNFIRLLLVLLLLHPFVSLGEELSKGTVLITGANRGLGLALSRHFLSDGYSVIGTARKPDKATELKHAGARVVQLDVADDDSIAAMVETLEGIPIDIVVNNAGYLGYRERGIASFKGTTREEFLYTFNVNTIGPVMVTRALLPNLLLSSKDVKKIINISSHGGIVDRKNVTTGYYAYDPSKTALNKITVYLSSDLMQSDIAVISLAPGHNLTAMGGEDGKLDPDFSMGKAQRVIEGITMEDTGTFIGYSGFSIDW